MFYGFFVRTGKTLKIAPKIRPFKDVPQLCSRGCKEIPHIISAVNQIIPQYEDVDKKSDKFIPLFAIMELDGNIQQSCTNKNFYLVFCPDTENPPPINDLDSILLNLYWSSIQPMFLCRDMAGYYLGCSNDSNVVVFEICNECDSDGSIRKAVSGFDESTCYGRQIEFAANKVFIRKRRNL